MTEDANNFAIFDYIMYSRYWKRLFDAASSSALEFSVRRRGFSNSAVVHDNSHFERDRKIERERDVMHPLRAVTHPFRSRFARTETHFDRTTFEISGKLLIRELWRGRIKALRRKVDSLAGERRTNDDEPSVAKGGGRLRRLPRRALTLGVPPARRTHACLRGRVRVAREDGFGARARAQDGGYTCTIIIPLQQRPNFWISRPFRSILRAREHGMLWKSAVLGTRDSRDKYIVLCNCDFSHFSDESKDGWW